MASARCAVWRSKIISQDNYTEPRLNSVAASHVRRIMSDEMAIVTLMKEFVLRSEVRKVLLGHFI